MKKSPSEDVGGVALSKILSYDVVEELTDDSTNRYYSFGIVTYDVGADILSFCQKMATHYCYRIHDKDDSSPHYHIFLSVRQNVTCKGLVNIFKCYQADKSQNTFCRPVKRDSFACYDYLMHVNHPDKYQYSEDGIVCDDVSKWVRIDNVKDNDFFCDDLFSDTICIREMCHKYGRDFMRNFKHYMLVREVVLNEKSDKC